MNKYRLQSMILAAIAAWMLAVRLWWQTFFTRQEAQRKALAYGPPTPLPFALFILPFMYAAAITTDYYLFQSIFFYIASISNEGLGEMAGWILPPCVFTIEIAVSIMAALQDSGLNAPLQEEPYPQYVSRQHRQRDFHFRWAYLKIPLLLAQVLSATAMYDALEKLNPELHTSNMLMTGFLLLLAGVCHYGVLNSGAQLLVLGRNIAGANARRAFRTAQAQELTTREPAIIHFQGLDHLREEYRRSYPGDSFNPALDPKGIEAMRIILGEAPPPKQTNDDNTGAPPTAAPPPNVEAFPYGYQDRHASEPATMNASDLGAPFTPYPQYKATAQAQTTGSVVQFPERPQAPPGAPENITANAQPLPGNGGEPPQLPVDPRDDNQF